MTAPSLSPAARVWRAGRDAWLRYWFTPETSENLGAARAIFFAGVLLLYGWEDLSAWGDVDRAFWMPVWAFARFGITPAGSAVLELIEWLFKLALLCGAIGVAPRLASGVACVLGFYLLGLPHNFGQTYHFDALLVFVFGILAVARSGDAVSIKALRESRRRAPSGEYRWPVRLAWLTMATVFCAAGLSKLRHSGLEWAFSENMSVILTKAHYGRSDADPMVDWGLFIARSPVLSQGLALVSLVVETAFPLALVSRHARLLLVPGAFMMLVGIRVLMGPTFGGFLLVFAFWIPWTAVAAAIRAAWPARGRYAMLYDGGCGTCGRTAAIVGRLDVLGRVDVLDAANDWAVIERRYKGLSQTACLEEMHVLTPDGGIARGFDAYRALGWALPIAWPLVPLLYVPGVRRIGQIVYRVVANRRSHQCVLADRPSAPASGHESRGRDTSLLEP
jgi:predicted DCC family thiol-disulfide oxidoreductase YuxK